MEKIMSCKATAVLSTIWLVVFALSKIAGVDAILSGKGINVIGNEYWRFLTAGFVQTNLIHTLGNIYLICWLGMKYEKLLGSSRFFIIGFIGSAIAYLVFSFVYKNAVSSVGGSGYWYALVGYILMQQLLTPEFPVVGRKWMLIYALVFLPVVPNVLWLNTSSAVFHGIAFAAGVVMGFFGIG